MASKILSDGQSSRIYRKLVYDSGVALAAVAVATSSSTRTCSMPPRLVQPGQTPEAAEKALVAELQRMKTEPVTRHELQRAKNQFARDYIMGRETNQQKARQLAHAAVIHDDITTADGEFDIFHGDHRRRHPAGRQDLLHPTNRLVITILPRSQTQ